MKSISRHIRVRGTGNRTSFRAPELRSAIRFLHAAPAYFRLPPRAAKNQLITRAPTTRTARQINKISYITQVEWPLDVALAAAIVLAQKERESTDADAAIQNL